MYYAFGSKPPEKLYHPLSRPKFDERKVCARAFQLLETLIRKLGLTLGNFADPNYFANLSQAFAEYFRDEPEDHRVDAKRMRRELIYELQHDPTHEEFMDRWDQQRNTPYEDDPDVEDDIIQFMRQVVHLDPMYFQLHYGILDNEDQLWDRSRVEQMMNELYVYCFM